MQVLSPVEAPAAPLANANWASAFLGSRYPIESSAGKGSQRQDASVSASAVATAAYWRKQNSERATATVSKHSSVPAPGPSQPWSLAEMHLHIAPGSGPPRRASFPPAPSLPPASMPLAKPGVPAWAHKGYTPKKVAISHDRLPDERSGNTLESHQYVL